MQIVVHVVFVSSVFYRVLCLKFRMVFREYACLLAIFSRKAARNPE